MYPVRVICRGCPAEIGGEALPDGSRVIDPAVVERPMPGTDLPAGLEPIWSWTELDLIDEEAGGATRAHRDALKLLAAFIQHSDTKPEQQRMVCLEGGRPEGRPRRTPGPADTSIQVCERPFMFLDDVGLTFGRANLTNANAIGSVNLQEWAGTPVWKGTDGCIGNLPKSFTGTLKDPAISEDGRRFLARLLAQFSDAQRRDLFETARVDVRPGASGDHDSKAARIDEWVEVFNRKEAEIRNRRWFEPWSVACLSPSSRTGPVVQSWASPMVTRVMNAVSLLLRPSYIAIAVFLTFCFRLRAGAASCCVIA